MSRRGQSAMEFLTTYGWALLVAIIVIGALVYFGVLNPARLVPDKCDFPGQLRCEMMNYNTQTAALTVSIRNMVGKQVTIWGATITGEKDSPFAKCSLTTLPVPNTVVAGEAINIVAQNCVYTGATPPASGQILDMMYTLQYTVPSQNNFPGNATGFLHFRAP